MERSQNINASVQHAYSHKRGIMFPTLVRQKEQFCNFASTHSPPPAPICHHVACKPLTPAKGAFEGMPKERAQKKQ